MNILEIEILTDNLIETEGFYANILKLPLLSKVQNDITFSAGKSTLIFKKSSALQPKYHFAFNIPNNKLEEAIQWAKPKLNLITITDNSFVANFESWNANAIYFYDNNQNILEFIARHDLPNASDQPFDISSILSISEIGIVSDTPLKLADQLVANKKLDYYKKGTKNENFATLGNDNGLFIIVATNRKWYPTEQIAEKHFTRIKIVKEGLTSEIIINEEDANG